MLRRMATVVAATTALALAGAAPALADEHFTDVDENFTTCAQAGLAGELLIGDEGDQQTSIDGLSGDVSADGTSLNVTVDIDEWEISGTVVKGGPGSRIYPGDPVPNMMAPHNPGGNVPQISHWYVCGTPKPPGTEPPGTEPPGTEPPGTEPPGNGDDKTPPPDGMGGGDETPKPAVPTDVPAGLSDSGNGGSAAGTVGLLALATGMAAGIMVLVRRRFLYDS